MAEILKRHGFSTHAVVASYPLKREMGFAQGFDEFSENFTQRYDNKKKKKAQFALANTVYKKILGQLKEAQGSKQFFWFHFFDIHAPYGDAGAKQHGMILKQPFHKAVAANTSPDKLKAMVDKAHNLYNKDARYLDTIIEKLFEKLKSEEKEYDTHIILVADHGESFGEDGSIAHGTRLTRWQTHVPCFIISPKIKKGVDNNIASSIDIMPTILNMAGITYNSPGGRSLLIQPKNKYAIYGMRRTYEKPFEEPRLDGKFHVLYENQYYMMKNNGATFKGNAKSVVNVDSRGSLEQQKYNIVKAKQMFGVFEKHAKSLRTITLKDKKTLSALKTLGYTQ